LEGGLSVLTISASGSDLAGIQGLGIPYTDIPPEGICPLPRQGSCCPVKFTLTQNNVATCALPPAMIAVTRTAGGTLGTIDESIYTMAADNGSGFRIDSTACQYIYNLASSSLGVGVYRIDIIINGKVVGNAVFALK